MRSCLGITPRALGLIAGLLGYVSVSHADVPNLDNLATYTLPAAAWSDRHSDIGVTWPQESKGGLQQLTTFVGWWGSSISDQLLKMAIDACRRAGKYIGICGQGPSDHPDLARWLVDQGIESMSLNPDTVVQTWMFLAGEELPECNA
ncbi:MAG TPA: putative PEP-binding protein [Steroidobacteraceae bacterium]|nr:putative PEP-binding protein [Steroidobacteraceae bacterium]